MGARVCCLCNPSCTSVCVQENAAHGAITCVPRGLLWDSLAERHWVPGFGSEFPNLGKRRKGMHDAPAQVSVNFCYVYEQ